MGKTHSAFYAVVVIVLVGSLVHVSKLIATMGKA